MDGHHDAASGCVGLMQSYVSKLTQTLAGLPLDRIDMVTDSLEEAQRRGRRVYVFGNGGSAATASHLAGDLGKAAAPKDRMGLRAFALNDSVPSITAWASDVDYKHIYSAQLGRLVEPGDVAIAISGSGNSPNMLNGVTAARILGATTIGLVGFGGGRLRHLVDIPVVVAGDSMEQVEDLHLVVGHLITTCLRSGAPSRRPLAALSRRREAPVWGVER